MDKYVCNICGYVYDEAEGDPDSGIAPGTKWEDVPEDWVPDVRRRQGRLFIAGLKLHKAEDMRGFLIRPRMFYR